MTRHSIKPCGINKKKDLESHTNIHISSNCINAWAWCLLWTMIRWSQYSLSNLENWSLWVLPESGLILLNVRDSRKTQLTYIIFLSFASRVGWLSFRYVVVFDRLFGAICQIHLCAHFNENPVGTHKTTQLKQLNGTYWHTTFIVQTQTHILKKRANLNFTHRSGLCNWLTIPIQWLFAFSRRSVVTFAYTFIHEN